MFMEVLLIRCKRGMKALSLICEGEDKPYIKRTGSAHSWDILFFIFSFLKGITVFTLILLIRTSWSFFKPYLQDKEMKVLMIVIPPSHLSKIGSLGNMCFCLFMSFVAVLFPSPLFVLSNSKGVFGVNFRRISHKFCEESQIWFWLRGKEKEATTCHSMNRET